MQWLTYEVALREFRSDAQQEVQNINFPADIAAMRQEIPVPPHYASSSEGRSSPVDRWFGQIGELKFIVECPADKWEWAAGMITLTLPFRDREVAPYDWTILLELQGLPRSICIARPLHITSRMSTTPQFAVYRPDTRGWNIPFYWTETREDAEGLLAYLRQDPGNDRCVIGKPEQWGDWEVVIRDGDRERRVAMYPDKDAALHVACESSWPRTPESSLIVRDASSGHPNEVYMIQDQKAVRLPQHEG